MTDLSPQAQAVLDAAFPAYDEENLYFLSGEQHTAKIAAGALREVVNQLQQSPGVVMCYDILELCDELDVL